MSGTFVDVALVSIERPDHDAVRLQHCKEVEVKTSKDTEAVATMNQRRIALGWTRKTKAVEGTIKVAQSSEPELDYEDMLNDDEEFSIYLQRGRGGQMRRLVGCIIDDISEGFSSDGTPTFDVHFMALDNVRVK